MGTGKSGLSGSASKCAPHGFVAAAVGIILSGAWGCGKAPRSEPREKTDEPASPSAPATRAGTALADGASDAARAAEDAPQTALALLERGRALCDEGDSQGAIAACSKAIALEPDLAEAYYVRGLTHQSAGENDLAIADFAEAIGKRPDFAKAYNARGLTYLLKCDYARTRSDLQRVIELDPHGETGASAKENLKLLGPQ